MYVGKKKIKEMAEYTDAVYEGMVQRRDADPDTDRYTNFIEWRGAYFTALKMADLAGIGEEVHEERKTV